MCIFAYVKGRCKEDGARLWSVVNSGRIRYNEQKMKDMRFPLTINKHFHCKGDQTLVQVAQQGYEVSVFGGI